MRGLGQLTKHEANEEMEWVILWIVRRLESDGTRKKDPRGWIGVDESSQDSQLISRATSCDGLDAPPESVIRGKCA